MWLVKTIKQSLSDLFINEWRTECDEKSSCTFYRIFKTNFGFNTYLTSIPFKKVQVGKDQEKAQSEKDSHSKNRSGKKPN